MHLAIIVVIVVVTTIVFVAGFFLFDSDTHSGWLVPIIETCIFSVGIGPLIVYLYELLIDRHGDWQRIAQIRNMTMDRMRLYRLAHATGAVACYLSLTVLEAIPLTIIFAIVHTLQSLFVSVILVFIPTMSDRSKNRSSKRDGSSLSDYLIQNDGNQLPDIVLEELFPSMMISPENLKYGEQIGSGAQGAVFKGTLLNSRGAEMAIKSIKKKDMFNQSASSDLLGFYRELQALYEHGNHPNIVRLMGIAEDENKISLVLELCSGGSLADLLQRCAEHRTLGEQPLITFSQKLRILLDIAAGMCHLHDRNLIHRDLKPENVLLSDAITIGTAKVADLGVAKSNQSSENKTMKIGTAAYVATEVLKCSSTDSINDPYDERCDVYSFGILMYAVLGDLVHPYGSTISDMDIIARLIGNPTSFRPPHDENTVDFIRQCIDNSHRWYVELMRQCWHVDPSQRPSFNRIAQLLRSYI